MISRLEGDCFETSTNVFTFNIESNIKSKLIVFYALRTSIGHGTFQFYIFKNETDKVRPIIGICENDHKSKISLESSVSVKFVIINY